jgi:protein-S-isoprenylcysteine O-methyltransferase Ste14
MLGNPPKHSMEQKFGHFFTPAWFTVSIPKTGRFDMTALSMVLRGFLFAGLAAHKLVWEVLKRGQRQPEAPKPSPQNLSLRIIKGGKIAITLGLFAQLFLPEILPITNSPLLPRVVGTIVFTFGLLIAILARLELGNNWSDIEVGQLKQNHMLVNRGVYRYVRHPIYTGDLAMLLGFELCLNSWLVVAVVAVAIPTIYRAVREEKVLAKTVAGYEAYCTQTKRFIPFVI